MTHPKVELPESSSASPLSNASSPLDQAQTMSETSSFPQLSDSSSAERKEHSKRTEPVAAGEAASESKLPKHGKAGVRTATIGNENVPKGGISKMYKFLLYETACRYFLVGSDLLDSKFRILKIDRTADRGDLGIAEDDIVYTKDEMNETLKTIDDGNKNSGGLKLKSVTWGLLGFVRFTGDYYMLLITKRSQVAVIGGHYIYQVDGTELVSLSSSARTKTERQAEEARFITILNNLDLTRSFYFSGSYDITHTLQYNICRERKALAQEPPALPGRNFNEMFVWNQYLLKPAMGAMKSPFDWCMPIIHGFVDQASLSIYGRKVYITIIARRSRLFAGARFLKRGANDLGYVANDVETEQIVSEMLTTSFHAPGLKLYSNPNYTSFVQHRGSIPLHWSQDSSGVTPKPDIELNVIDPYYTAAALHFDNLFERYGAPIYVLNLVKARERTPRESILLKEYTKAIEYLNQFLPSDQRIVYKAWDMSRASKSRDQDVIGSLESIAADVIRTTSFFHNGDGQSNTTRTQNGVARTNCIDCLDRTNAAQFVIGKLALGHQLHALGIIDNTSIEYDTDAVNLFTHMYHDHGDTIAIQYGGSHLVNTMETYRKINQWTSHSRDMVESVKRYYNNSFLDAQRQEAYNLFLGNYTFVLGQPMLWDLATDYYLHHSDPRTWSTKAKKNYINWFNPTHLERRELPSVTRSGSSTTLQLLDDYWLEYYRPLALSSFPKIFSYRMNSTIRYIPFRTTQEGKYDLSPFRVRGADGHDNSDRTPPRTGMGIIDDQELPKDREQSEDIRPSSRGTLGSTFASWTYAERSRVPEAVHFELVTPNQSIAGLTRSSTIEPSGTKPTEDKSAVAQWTLNQFVVNSLNPTVTSGEMDEYSRYISHPLNLPLVVSSDTAAAPNPEFLKYIQSISADDPSRLRASEENILEYVEFLEVADDPLTVTDADGAKKRYKAYKQWLLKGKSLFKQSRVDP